MKTNALQGWLKRLERLRRHSVKRAVQSCKGDSFSLTWESGYQSGITDAITVIKYSHNEKGIPQKE